MRFVKRNSLPPAAVSYLARKQRDLMQRSRITANDVHSIWKLARQTNALTIVLQELQRMMGPRERCMYCLDSHGSDIEHFRPKSKYHSHIFQWKNLLLCCTECGRLKGAQFPVLNKKVLLINPTTENPWDYIDFDTDTGNLMARVVDAASRTVSKKGKTTVEMFHLNERESLSAGYLQTFHRLSAIVRNQLSNLPISPTVLIEKLKAEDDHGLLQWCFSASGTKTAPFSDLYHAHLASWKQCLRLMKP